MQTLELKVYGVQEMNRQEMVNTNGGGELWNYTGSNPITGLIVGIRNTYVLVKDLITGDETTSVYIDDAGKKTPVPKK